MGAMDFIGKLLNQEVGSGTNKTSVAGIAINNLTGALANKIAPGYGNGYFGNTANRNGTINAPDINTLEPDAALKRLANMLDGVLPANPDSAPGKGRDTFGAIFDPLRAAIDAWKKDPTGKSGEKNAFLKALRTSHAGQDIKTFFQDMGSSAEIDQMNALLGKGLSNSENKAAWDRAGQQTAAATAVATPPILPADKNYFLNRLHGQTPAPGTPQFFDYKKS